jgi:hypothetical protein
LSFGQKESSSAYKRPFFTINTIKRYKFGAYWALKNIKIFGGPKALSLVALDLAGPGLISRNYDGRGMESLDTRTDPQIRLNWWRKPKQFISFS